eukprot:4383602-Amphidinium_carterae.1
MSLQSRPGVTRGHQSVQLIDWECCDVRFTGSGLWGQSPALELINSVLTIRAALQSVTPELSLVSDSTKKAARQTTAN